VSPLDSGSDAIELRQCVCVQFSGT